MENQPICVWHRAASCHTGHLCTNTPTTKTLPIMPNTLALQIGPPGSLNGNNAPLQGIFKYFLIHTIVEMSAPETGFSEKKSIT